MPIIVVTACSLVEACAIAADRPDAAPIDAPVLDVAPAPDAPRCTADIDCPTDDWCARPPRCAPADPTADAHGCTIGDPVTCPPLTLCDASARACVTCDDGDRDGAIAVACGGDDCDDTDPILRPSNPHDGCDGRDDDCDGTVDENPDVTLYEDRDGDGWGPMSTGRLVCSGDGLVSRWGDCDDEDPLRHAMAPETVCNRITEDCTGRFSPGEDYDDDGFAPIDATCRDDLPGSRPRLDCYDRAPLIGPGQPEICNGLDDDCDPSTPDGSAAENGCLSGHACTDGACRHTVALGAAPGVSYALLSDGSLRFWNPSTDCGFNCYTLHRTSPDLPPITALDRRCELALDAAGTVIGLRRALVPWPAATLVGGGCIVRSADGALDCGSGPIAGPTDIVSLGVGTALTASGELWVHSGGRAERVIDSGVATLDPGGACVVMSDGTARCQRTMGGPYTALAGIGGATEVASGTGAGWFLRGDEDGVVVELGGSSQTMPGSAGMRGLVAGDLYACALAPDERVVCWVLPTRPDRTSPLGLPDGWPDAPMYRTVGGL